MNNDQKIRVGSRKSELALIQTRHVISLLKQIHPQKEFEIVSMSTLGDQVLDIPLPKIGEKSLFTKELEVALSTGSVDFVVHSLKDLPTCLPPGMAIGAVLTREDPRDALVLQKDLDRCSLASLPTGSVIGTSSLRRAAQLARKYPHLKVENIRGNLNTRLRKLDELGKYQGIILAAAGLIRMGWNRRITAVLENEELLYAVGQGALAVECRANDDNTIALLQPLYDLKTALSVIAERSFLKTLGGGCSAPVAVQTELKNLKDTRLCLEMKGAVWSLDGSEEILGLDKCEIELLNGKRCLTCPYNQNRLASAAGAACDIENLRYCEQCPESPAKEQPAKKAKLEVPTEVLRNDPHESCPVQIPIGADFMGQCPYLESGLLDVHGKCPKSIEDMKEMAKQCPFMKNGKLHQTLPDLTENVQSCSESDNETFCGLVRHDSVTKSVLERVESLGRRLAEGLMAKGATEVMSAAQATIHQSIGVVAEKAC